MAKTIHKCLNCGKTTDDYNTFLEEFIVLPVVGKVDFAGMYNEFKTYCKDCDKKGNRHNRGIAPKKVYVYGYNEVEAHLYYDGVVEVFYAPTGEWRRFEKDEQKEAFGIAKMKADRLKSLR